jgi:hypothetical protein
MEETHTYEICIYEYKLIITRQKLRTSLLSSFSEEYPYTRRNIIVKFEKFFHDILKSLSFTMITEI